MREEFDSIVTGIVTFVNSVTIPYTYQVIHVVGIEVLLTVFREVQQLYLEMVVYLVFGPYNTVSYTVYLKLWL